MSLVSTFTTEQKVLGVIIVCVVFIVTYFKWAFTYWKKRGVPDIIEPKFPFGSFRKVLPNRISTGDRFKHMYTEIKARGLKYGGAFLCTSPLFVVIDVNHIKSLLQKDFHHFTERGFYHNEKDDPLSANLFAIGGDKWRQIRTKLSPAFTAGKLKMMFENLVLCSKQMREALEDLYQSQRTINMTDVAECFTIDVIGSCAFGVKCNCFKNPKAEFKEQGRKIFFFTPLRVAKIIFCFAYPRTARWLGLTLFDKGSNRFFINVVKETIQFRETNKVYRKDILQLLLELNKEPDDDSLGDFGASKKNWTVEELTAQVFIFFAAGFETSSITLAYCLYELAQNLAMQEKVRGEINRTLMKEEGKITYEGVMDMKYLNQVVEETLRKYPPVSFITRVCVKDYVIPGTKTVLEKGTDVGVPIIGLHHDPDYYPNPDKFDPERFSEENKRQRHPFAYIPFGEGPRICIGLRFGLMQVKVGLIALLKDYRYSLNKKTEVPIQMEPNSFSLLPKNGIFLDMEKIV